MFILETRTGGRRRRREKLDGFDLYDFGGVGWICDYGFLPNQIIVCTAFNTRCDASCANWPGSIALLPKIFALLEMKFNKCSKSQQKPRGFYNRKLTVLQLARFLPLSTKALPFFRPTILRAVFGAFTTVALMTSSSHWYATGTKVYTRKKALGYEDIDATFISCPNAL